VALGIAIGRVGEFLDGHGQGLPSALPWATRYVSPLAATPDISVPRHPTQLYDALVLLVLSAVLLWLPRRLPWGSSVALFLIVYGAATIGLGWLRLDPSFLFGWQLEQLLAAAGLLAGLAIGLGIVRRSLARRDRTNSPYQIETDATVGSAVATGESGTVAVPRTAGQVASEDGVAA
jgi:phosphatidylglycerol:prolipoprotein diacylglycerol transferase